MSASELEIRYFQPWIDSNGLNRFITVGSGWIGSKSRWCWIGSNEVNRFNDESVQSGWIDSMIEIAKCYEIEWGSTTGQNTRYNSKWGIYIYMCGSVQQGNTGYYILHHQKKDFVLGIWGKRYQNKNGNFSRIFDSSSHDASSLSWCFH